MYAQSLEISSAGLPAGNSIVRTCTTHVISESGPEGAAEREGEGAAPPPIAAVAESRMAAAATATGAPPSPSPPRPPAAIPTAMPGLWQARYSRGGGSGSSGREEPEVGMKSS